MFQGLFSEKQGVVEKQEWAFKSDKSWSVNSALLLQICESLGEEFPPTSFYWYKNGNYYYLLLTVVRINLYIL